MGHIKHSAIRCMSRDLLHLLTRLDARNMSRVTDAIENEHSMTTTYRNDRSLRSLVQRADSEIHAGAEMIIYWNAMDSQGNQLLQFDFVKSICEHFHLHSLEDVAHLSNVVVICQTRDSYLNHQVSVFRQFQR